MAQGRMKFCSCLLFVGLYTTHALGVPVNIRVVLLPDQKPMTAKVTRITKDRTVPLGEVNPQGKMQISEDACSLETTYLVTPIPKSEFESRLNPPELPCNSSSEILFEFYYARDVAAVAPVVKGELPSDWLNVSGVSEGFSTIGQYVWTGDYGTAAILGVEAAAKLRETGAVEIAKSYEEIAAFYGLAAISDKIKTTGNLYNYDPGQSRFVISADGVKAIQTYQEKFGLAPTGRLDWKTLSSQSALAQSDPTALFDAKTKLLQDIGVGDYQFR